MFADDVMTTQICTNGTGVTAEPATTKVIDVAEASATKSSSPSATTSGKASTSTPGSAGNVVRVAGGAVLAAVVGGAAWML